MPLALVILFRNNAIFESTGIQKILMKFKLQFKNLHWIGGIFREISTFL